MHMQTVRAIAQERGIKPGRMTKVDLIRTLQQAEGNTSCFATDEDGSCPQMGCLWREDCQTAARSLARKG